MRLGFIRVRVWFERDVCFDFCKKKQKKKSKKKTKQKQTQNSSLKEGEIPSEFGKGEGYLLFQIRKLLQQICLLEDRF